jgi:hypothetical protein
MYDKSPVEFHREAFDLRKEESKLKKLLSIPRWSLDQQTWSEPFVTCRERLLASSPSCTRSLNLRAYTIVAGLYGPRFHRFNCTPYFPSA